MGLDGIELKTVHKYLKTIAEGSHPTTSSPEVSILLIQKLALL